MKLDEGLRLLGWVPELQKNGIRHWSNEEYPDHLIKQRATNNFSVHKTGTKGPVKYTTSGDEAHAFVAGLKTESTLRHWINVVNEELATAPNCVGPCLYHATFAQRVPGIMQHGLGNKPPTRNYDISRNAVYLADHPDAAKAYAEEAASDHNIKDEIIVLLVDQRRLDPTLLHKDANDQGVMSWLLAPGETYRSYEYYGVIPPSAVTVY